MASGKIFIGNIMADMVDALGSMEESMEDQIDKMDDQIAELENINTAVGQTVISGNLGIGTDNTLILNTSDININGSGTTEVARVNSFAKGTITITGKIKSNTPSGTATLQYSIDNGSTKVNVGTTQSTGYVSVSANVNITTTTTIIIYFNYNWGGNIGTLEANSCKINYNVLNLAVDGYIVKI